MGVRALSMKRKALMGAGAQPRLSFLDKGRTPNPALPPSANGKGSFGAAPQMCECRAVEREG